MKRKGCIYYKLPCELTWSPLSLKNDILVQHLEPIERDLPAPRQQDLLVTLCLLKVIEHRIHNVVGGMAHQEFSLLLVRGQVDEAIPLHGVAIATVKIVEPCVEAAASLLSPISHRRLIASPPVLSMATVRCSFTGPVKRMK